MELFSHNQKAYEAIKECFEVQNRAAVVHATGTGKSYIIARTAQDFNRVLVIAPNHFVLSETQKVCPDYTDFRTYASVMYDKSFDSNYDLIVLDEFHRSGAEKWGKGIKRLLKACPDAKILGTSATHIRYLDDQRNMADELFDGHIVSHISLKDAIDMNILPNPTYVTALYSLDEITKTLKNRIRKSSKSDEEKQQGLRTLRGIAQSWDKSEGVPGIMKKYMRKDMQRIIVFCSKVNKKEQARRYLGSWLATAGFSRIRFYNIDYKEKRLAKEMEDFQQPCQEGELKVAMSVNMLNEGVHIPRVDGIIMLRSTISRIIIEQQVGRCLTASNKCQVPVVLDLVNNIESVNNFGFVEFSEWQKGGENTGESSSEDKGFPFHITDEIRDIRILLSQLDHGFLPYNTFSFEEKCREIEMFIAEHGELPTTTNGGKPLLAYVGKFRSEPLRSLHPECVERFSQMGFNMTQIEDRYFINLQQCKDFLSKHGRIPVVGVHSTEKERILGRFLKAHWNKRSNNTDEQRLILCKEGLVSPISEEVWRFAEEQKKLGNLPRDVEYGGKPISAKVDEVIAYFKKHGTLPPCKHPSRLMAIAQSCVAQGNKEVVRLYNAGIFNGTMKLTTKVVNILKRYGVEVNADDINLSPVETLNSLIKEYGSFKNSLAHKPKETRYSVRAIYISATDEECIRMFNDGIYIMNYSEVRRRLTSLAEQKRIDISVDEIKTGYVPERKLSDEDLFSAVQQLGRLPIMSHKGEAILYCSIRNRWKARNPNPQYLQKLIDMGLYLPTSETFKEKCALFNLTVPETHPFKK